MTSYNKFAKYYDILTDNIDYQDLSQYYDRLIKRFGGIKGILLDLACGTGSLSEKMAEQGYDVIGVDLSCDMLSKAMEKKIQSGHKIQYLCQDMCELDLFGTVDVTICSLDSLNHLDNIDCVRQAIEKVSLFTNPDGLFIFDMNTVYKHNKILADNVFVYDTDEVYCVWENELQEDNVVDINLTFFENEDECYYRYDENFSETAYCQNVIDTILKDSGFEVLVHYADFKEECVKEDTQRITYVARKVK